ncbi:MAG: ATP-binding protein, partial [Sulfolobales archaeon]|nr:ATP-binding protein [Sulfolobales archaeon]
TTDKLEELFRGEKVLVLFDEMVWYLSRLRGTLYDSYYRQCLNFFEALANVTTKMPVVSVVTIAAEYKDDKVLAESGYEAVAEELSKRILKVGSVYKAPIETETDLAGVLKKRIFERINDSAISDLARRYSELAERFKQYVDDKIVQELPLTYPFHPLYVSALRSLVENHKGLQRTRDALKITRKAVRKLWNHKPPRSVVLPSDIDVSDGEIKLMLVKDYPDYDSVLEEIKRSTKVLAIYSMLASYIFLRTFYYKLGLDVSGSLAAALPDSREAVTSAVDPVYLNELKQTPSDLRGYLDDMLNGAQNPDHVVPFLVSNKDRYWFTFYFDPKTKCKSDRDKVPTAEAEDWLKRIIIELAEDLEKRSRKTPPNVGFLKLYTSVVSDLDKLIEADEPSYTLVIIDKPACPSCTDDSQIKDAVRRFIYSVAPGGSPSSPRRYSNTIAVMFSLSKEGMRQKMLDYAKEYLACDRLDVSQYYKEEVLRNVARKIISEYMTSLRNAIYAQVFHYYDRLAFPDGRNDVKIVSLTSEGKTLMGEAWSTLVKEDKVVTDNEINFGYLEYYLKNNVGIKIEGMTFSQLRDMFYANSLLPWVSEDGLRKALIDGVTNRKIGLQTGSRIYFKAQDSNIKIDDSTLIISAEEAAQREIEDLIKQEKVMQEGDRVIREYYVVVTQDGTEIPIASLMGRQDWLSVYVTGRIEERKEEKEEGVEIMAPTQAQGLEGEEMSVRITVKKVGNFSGKVSLEASEGAIEPKEGVPPFDAVLKVRPERSTAVTIVAKYGDKIKTHAIQLQIEKKEEEPLLSSVGTTTQITVIEVLKPGANLPEILSKFRQIIGVKEVEGELILENPGKVTVVIRPAKMELGDFVTFLRNELSNIGSLSARISGSLRVKISKFKRIEEGSVNSINELISKGVIAVRGKREGQ